MRKLLLLAFVMLSTIITNAQNEKGDITIAPQIGYNFSTYYVENIDFNNRSAFTAGVIGEYYFNDRWSLRTGLIYDAKGAEDRFGNTDKLNYVSIPLNANWHFGKKRNWYLNFGPAISFLTNAETEFANGSTVDIKDAIKSTDFGLALGIGYKFAVSENIELYIDYQGMGGFSGITEDNVQVPATYRNSRSSFNVGGVFKL